MLRKEIYISYSDGNYRIYRSYAHVEVDKGDDNIIHIKCYNPDRNIYVNKSAIHFIDINDVIEE